MLVVKTAKTSKPNKFVTFFLVIKLILKATKNFNNNSRWISSKRSQSVGSLMLAYLLIFNANLCQKRNYRSKADLQPYCSVCIAEKNEPSTSWVCATLWNINENINITREWNFVWGSRKKKCNNIVKAQKWVMICSRQKKGVWDNLCGVYT